MPESEKRKRKKNSKELKSLGFSTTALSLSLSEKFEEENEEEEEEEKSRVFYRSRVWASEGILICEKRCVSGKRKWRRNRMDAVPSNSHGNLDEQIAQLMQCKPLSEPEVPPLLLFIIFIISVRCHFCYFLYIYMLVWMLLCGDFVLNFGKWDGSDSEMLRLEWARSRNLVHFFVCNFGRDLWI